MSDTARLAADARIAVIGCGKMGEAVLSGWLASSEEPARGICAQNVIVVEPSADARDRLSAKYGIDAVADVDDLPSCDIYVLAVKPQVMPDVLDKLSSALGDNGGGHTAAPLVITIAAGIPTEVYERALPFARVVRVMPNMPLQVGMGASVVAAGASAAEDDARLVNALFSALGISSMVPEDQIDAVCAISGGGPAYVAYMIEALRDAGEALGLDGDLAEQLALQTVGGTWRAMSERAVTPEDMRKSVCSPGGTTLAALAAMDAHDFKQMYADAMSAAVRRAAELREGASQ